MQIFNEKALFSEIVRIWGQYGAHAEVYAMLLKRAEFVQEATDLLLRAKTSLEELPKSMGYDFDYIPQIDNLLEKAKDFK